MDPSQDNPIVRFKAFFWALTVFAFFGTQVNIMWRQQMLLDLVF